MFRKWSKQDINYLYSLVRSKKVAVRSERALGTQKRPLKAFIFELYEFIHVAVWTGSKVERSSKWDTCFVG